MLIDPRQVKWDQPEAPAPDVEVLGMKLPDWLGATMIGAGKATARLGQGAKQLYYGATGNDAEQEKLRQQVEEEDRLYKPLKEARPWATGIGEALPSLAVPVGGGAGMLASAGRAAIAGAAPGVLEYGSAGERLQRGAIGAVAGAGAPLVGAGVKTAHALAEPFYGAGRERIVGRTLNRAADVDAAAVAQRLRNAQQLVPGSAPTAAQVAESGGISALERSAAAANPQAYTQRAMEQSSARLNALRGIAKDDSALASAITSRELGAAPLYAAADAGVAPIDGTFQSLLKRPQFASAVTRAQEMAKNSGLADIFFRDAQGNPTALLGEGAHLVKKALDEAGEFGATSYTGKQGARTAADTNGLFQSWLDKSIPEYKAASQRYATLSEPVNQMQVGRSLLDSVSPALADYGALGRESAATYARALRNGDQVAAKATGMSGAKLADVMTPQQMQMLEAIGYDLGRKANAQDLGRGVGSDTFQKLAMNDMAARSGMPNAVGGLLGAPGVSRALSWVYRDADQKMQQQLAETLLNPAAAGGLMTKTAPKLKGPARKLLEQQMLRAGLLGAPALGEFVGP